METEGAYREARKSVPADCKGDVPYVSEWGADMGGLVERIISDLTLL